METRVAKFFHVCVVVAVMFALAATGLMSCAKKNGVLAEIVLTPSSPSVAIGYSLQLAAQGVLSDGVAYYITSLTWSSSDPGIAQVDANGVVTAGTVTGIVTITATEHDSHKNITGSIDLEVASIKSIAVTPANPGMAINTAHQFHAMATLSNGATQDLTSCLASALTWTTSPLGVATVASTPGVLGSGVVTAGTVIGQTSITVIDLISNLSGSTPLIVTSTPLASIAVAFSDPAITSLTTGSNQQLIATATYADSSQMDRTLSMTWSSSNLDMATVSDSGLVSTLTATGTVTITATDPITARAGNIVLSIN